MQKEKVMLNLTHISDILKQFFSPKLPKLIVLKLKIPFHIDCYLAKLLMQIVELFLIPEFQSLSVQKQI